VTPHTVHPSAVKLFVLVTIAYALGAGTAAFVGVL
jgi:hypothetical protein